MTVFAWIALYLFVGHLFGFIVQVCQAGRLHPVLSIGEFYWFAFLWPAFLLLWTYLAFIDARAAMERRKRAER